MKIYTKKGDEGQTSLFGGKRMPKNQTRIEAYGTIDELNSHIGFLRDSIVFTDIQNELIKIQEELFTLGSHIASDPDKVDKLQLPEFNDTHIFWLEEKMDDMEEVLPEMKNFILPGGHQAVSYCHVVRSVCRRAERCLVALHQTEPVDSLHLRYMNRLSDYFFVLSRKLSQDLNAKETPWKPFN